MFLFYYFRNNGKIFAISMLEQQNKNMWGYSYVEPMCFYYKTKLYNLISIPSNIIK